MYNKNSINKASAVWKRFSSFASGCMLVVALVFSAAVHGQEAAPQEPGAITGQVTSKGTKRSLINVSIKVVDTPISTTTDQDGNYTIRNLTPGSHALIFEYTGLDTMRVPVYVESDKTITLDIEMTSDVYVLDTFVVASDREGQAQAIQQQKMAVDSRYVLAADSFGNMQDGNIGELLKQIPGVMVFDSVTSVEGEGAPGELTSFRFRGAMDDQSALVTMNGNEASSAGSIGGASRNFSLRNFNVDHIESVEFFKSATPAHPGNSLGGLVNFTTRSAFAQKGRRIKLDATMNFIEGYFGIGSRQHGNLEPTRQFYPSMSLNYSEAFFQGTPNPVGISLSVGARRSARYGINLEPAYADPSGGIPWGQPPEELAGVPVGATSYRWQDEDSVNDSLSAALTVDFKVSHNTTAYIITSWEKNKQIDGGYRRLQATTSSYIPGSTMDRINGTEAQGATLNASIGLFRYENETFRINPGMKHTWGDFILTYDAFYNKSTMDRNEKRLDYYLGSPSSDVSGNAATRVKFMVDGINSNGEDGASLNIVSGADPAELDNWGNLTLGYRPQYVNDIRYGGKIDAKKSLLFRFPIQFQAGGAYNVRDSAYSRPEYKYDFTGADKLLGTPDDPKLGSFQDRNRGKGGFYFSDRLPSMAWVSPDAIWEHSLAYPDQFWGQHGENARTVLASTKAFTEKVTAAYFMGTWKIFDFTIMAGARWERTDNSTNGYIRMREAGASSDVSYEPDAAERAFGQYKPISALNSYDNWLPGVHLRYEPVKNLVFRGSVTNDIGRPSVSNMIPDAEINHEGKEIKVGNPDLVPQTGRNYNLDIEYYIKNGVVSLSGFYKDQRNRIESVESLVAAGIDNGFDGMYEGYKLTTSVNSTHVKIQGFEISFRQRLYYLPWKLSNLNLSLDYTYNESKRTIPNSGAWIETKNFGTPRDTANAALSYTGRRIDWRVRGNWRGSWSNSYFYWSVSDTLRSYMEWDETLQVDVSATYKIGTKWSIYFDWRNVTGEGQMRRWNYAGAMRLYQRGFSNISIGLRGNF